MAVFRQKLAEFILGMETGDGKQAESNNPNDLGGLTHKGLIWVTFKGLCLKVTGVPPTLELFHSLTDEQVGLFVKFFWDWDIHGDSINSQPIAEFITDWDWGSGLYARENVQICLGFPEETVDGVFGQHTIGAINSQEPGKLLKTLLTSRLDFYQRIVKNNPSQGIFLNGWNRRANTLYVRLVAEFFSA